MQKPDKPRDEQRRQQVLDDLRVLDTSAESIFDAIVAAAASVCGTPISLLSLIDRDRQWFKANHGLDGVCQTPRDVSFCGHAINGSEILEVRDALADPRFADNPLVTQDKPVRFYAGCPLQTESGARIGTLCVIAHEPHQLNPNQREALEHLARAAVQALQTRRAALDVASHEARFETLCRVLPVGVFATDSTGRLLFANQACEELTGVDLQGPHSAALLDAVAPDDQDMVARQFQHAVAHRRSLDIDFSVLRPGGFRAEIKLVLRPVVSSDQPVMGFVGCLRDVTQAKESDRQQRLQQELFNRTAAIAKVGGWELDLRSNRLWWSDQTCVIHGVARGYTPTLEEALAFYSVEDQPRVREAVDRAIVTGQGWDEELTFFSRDGRQLAVRAVGQVEYDQGRPVRLSGTFQDITDDIRQRRDLEAARQQVALATQHGGMGIWEVDVTSRAHKWSAGSFHLFGVGSATALRPHDVLKRSVHPEDLLRVEKAFSDALDHGSRLDVTFRVVWANGSTHHIRAVGQSTTNGPASLPRIVGVFSDVTQLLELNSRLFDQHEMLRVTLKSIGEAVITTDSSATVTWMNPVAERLTGWSCDAATGRQIYEIFRIVNDKTREPLPDPVQLCLRNGHQTVQGTNTLLVSRSGQEYGILETASPILSEAQYVLGAVLAFRDVTEHRRLASEMTHRATHDSLTGLVNRAEFQSRLTQLIERAQDQQTPHALLYIDLDQFKLLNDACGHPAGDLAIQQIARLLSESVRSRDTLARLGGDEFAVILEHCSEKQAQRVAENIRTRVEEYRFVHGDVPFRMFTSIGLVPIDSRWSNPAAAMQAADTACYAAKEGGRNRVHTWRDTDTAIRTRHGNMQWATRLEQALDADRIELFAQRIYPLRGQDHGLKAEVLMRLREPNGELVAPGAFLPAAERFALATRIDHAVLAKAIAHLKRLPSLESISMLSINLSGQSVGDRAFHSQAISILRQAGTEVCRRLCLEITETAAVSNPQDAADFINRVRSLGVSIALDDFGVGAVFFGYLKTLVVDVIKIDGSFIRDIVDDPLDDVSVRSFRDVARVINVQTVAEFVDCPEVLARLQEIGIDYGQGFLLHKPEPLADVLEASASPTWPLGSTPAELMALPFEPQHQSQPRAA